jgi:AraC-like DNA-binding protein
METTHFFFILLVVSLTLMVAQLGVRNKQIVHLLFAIFSGSIAMMAAKHLALGTSGTYAYIIGLGACATCNGFWLVSRALFREHSAINYQHIFAASSVALLLMTKQTLFFWRDYLPIETSILFSIDVGLGELVNLLSSTMLVLTFWEGCRGFSKGLPIQRMERIAFLSCFTCCVLACTVGVKLLPNNNVGQLLGQFFVVASALAILLTTQTILVLRTLSKKVIQSTSSSNINDKKTEFSHLSSPEIIGSHVDSAPAQKLYDLLVNQQLFLQANLKVGDLARSLNLPEYKISQMLRRYFKARNFNQLVNTLRIQYAKELLDDPKNHHWPIVVIGLESGFASVGPFSRAFKDMVGFTPNEYRQRNLSQSEIHSSKLASNI